MSILARSYSLSECRSGDVQRLLVLSPLVISHNYIHPIKTPPIFHPSAQRQWRSTTGLY